MLAKIRERSPALLWIIIVVLLAAGGLLMARRPASQSAQQDMASHIVIRFEDTGDEIKMVRGMFERQMMARGIAGPVNPAEGITNPTTGKPTGFPVDKEYWEGLVRAANALRKDQPPGGPAH